MPSKVSSTAWLALGLVLLALAVRIVGAVASFDQPLVFDPQDYDRIARSIVAGGGYPEAVTPRGGPSAYRPPAFPVLLAGVYGLTGHVSRPAPFVKYFAPGYRPPARQVNAGLLLQAILGTIAVALTGLVGGLVAGPRIGLWALAISALYLPLIALGFTLYSEPLFIVFELAALACALKARFQDGPRVGWAVAAGVLVGLAWLTRSDGFLLLLPIGLLVWTERPRLSLRGLRLPLLTLLVTLLTVAPWTLRNAEVMHAFVPVSDEAGYTLAGTYNPSAEHNPQYVGGWEPAQDDPTDDRLILTSRGELDEGNRLQSAALRIIRAHPFYVVKAAVCNTARMAYLGAVCGDQGSLTLGYEVEDGLSHHMAELAIVVFALVALLALAGLITRTFRAVPLSVWLVPGVMATIVLIEGGSRFRAPLEPFMILLAAFTAEAAWQRRPTRRTRPSGPCPSGIRGVAS